MIDWLYINWEKFATLFRNYSNIIFFCFVALLVGSGIYLLGTVTTSSLEGDSNTSALSSQTFDQNTIDQIKKLQSSDVQPEKAFTLPSPRPNPLVE